MKKNENVELNSSSRKITQDLNFESLPQKNANYGRNLKVTDDSFELLHLYASELRAI